MSRSRLTGLIVAALLAISIGLYISTQRNATHESHDAALFPALGAEVATVTSIDIKKGSASPVVTLHKKAEQWLVAQRADYPADVSRLRKLLLAMSDAKIIEEKTSDPANYAQINVDDPTQAAANGVQVDFTAKDGPHTLIVGKPSGSNNFVRRGGEKTSYLVAPGVYVEFEPRLWIDNKLLEIPADNIERIEYKPVSGAPYSVHRVAPAAAPTVPPASGAAAAAAPTPPPASAAPEYALVGAPAGRKAADSPTLSPSPSIFGSITADDVAPAASIDFSKPASALITMKDGSSITLTGTVVGDKHWIQVNAPKDDALMSRSAGRAFQINGYRYDGMFRPLEQLLVPKPAPPEKTAQPPKPSAKPLSSVTSPPTAP